LSQITQTRPRRRMMRHFSHILLVEGLTFILFSPLPQPAPLGASDPKPSSAARRVKRPATTMPWLWSARPRQAPGGEDRRIV